MGNQELAYHRQRERECREMAERAEHPEIRRRHEQLANLHADMVSRMFDQPA